MLATRSTPILPGREARLQLRDAAQQMAEILATQLRAEERLRLRSQEIYRDVISAATGGKLELMERDGLERQLAALRSVASITVRAPRDVRAASAGVSRSHTACDGAVGN
ncbi:MAG: hypothetical protein KGM44_01535, partial [bacterium]|nr:hypothetical protein [bacterium]